MRSTSSSIDPGHDDVLLFVYGTLQRFQIDHSYWMLHDNIIFIGTATTTEAYPLFVADDVNNCPVVMLDCPGQGHVIQGELFRMPAEHVSHMQRFEEAALWDATGQRLLRKDIAVEVIATTGVRRTTRSDDRVHRRMVASCFMWAPPPQREDGAASSSIQNHITSRSPCPNTAAPREMMAQFHVARCLVANPTYRCIPRHRAVEGLTLPHHDNDGTAPMVLVILDGVGDVQCRILNGRTPLEAACDASPALSLITQHGVSGIMDPYAPGYACGSDTAHLSMLGYDPTVYYRGRGAFESLGAGMSMTPEADIAFKCNFSVTVDNDEDVATTMMPHEDTPRHAARQQPIVLHRRCDREFTKEGPILCAALDGTVLVNDVNGCLLEHGPHIVRVTYATEHRCGVVITGEYLSDNVTGTDPLSDGLRLVECSPSVGFEEDTRASYTCRVVMAASVALATVLHTHPINDERRRGGKRPANIVLLRGAAMRGDVPDVERRHGLKGFMVAPTCIIRGLGACIGLDIVESVGGTGDYHSNLLNKAKAVVDTFSYHRGDVKDAEKQEEGGRRCSRYQFGVLHVKGVDDAGHDADPEMKVEMLRRSAEAIDYLWNHMPPGTTIAVTGDHSTICAMEDHTTEPVPLSIARIPPRTRQDASAATTTTDAVHDEANHKWDGTPQFTEVACAVYGSLGRIRGGDLMEAIKSVHYGYL